jgi:hypothetical protein
LFCCGWGTHPASAALTTRIKDKICWRAERAGAETVFAKFSHKKINDHITETHVHGCVWCVRATHGPCQYAAIDKLLFRYDSNTDRVEECSTEAVHMRRDGTSNAPLLAPLTKLTTEELAERAKWVAYEVEDVDANSAEDQSGTSKRGKESDMLRKRVTQLEADVRKLTSRVQRSEDRVNYVGGAVWDNMSKEARRRQYRNWT